MSIERNGAETTGIVRGTRNLFDKDNFEINYKYINENGEVVETVNPLGASGYITIMELISILENYAEINPAAAGWILKLIGKFKNGGNEK